MRRVLIYAIVFSMITFAINVYGAPIIFTYQGIGTGHLYDDTSDIEFTDANFTVTAVGDTDNRILYSPGVYYLEHDYASINITGVGTFDLLIGTTAYVGNTLEAAGFIYDQPNERRFTLFETGTDPAFSSWDMLSSIGPISGMGEIMYWTERPIWTTGGRLIIRDRSCPTIFQATTASSGGGQRIDVDSLLIFLNPEEQKVDLPAGTTSYDVEIMYGGTIDAGTFEVTLNKQPFGGFTPVAGEIETVSIPLSSGRNVLKLQVDGTRDDGKTATDKDTLTFIVP